MNIFAFAGILTAITSFVFGYFVFLTIQDNGIGVSKEDASEIFSKFFRTKRAMLVDTEGMGIDLFVAKNIIERHRGTISVSSEGEDKGSIFRVTLPT